ncbi:DUF6622 family protein [Solimonas marina]|uniref:DUF1453 domain-containing protein n=1 Tax=Solimonas marina TaxID=2714601 RepID=A0A969W5Z3_9GAMM|nr:DUF6622 family protein [Solimonas marina]NKF21182.1 hypothetical protein [Solimonas marina]
MALDIVRHTPIWVWIALAVLIQRGLAMRRAQDIHLARAFLLPGVFVVLSLLGVCSTFGVHPAALACWAAGLGAMALSLRSLGAPRGARYDATTRRFHLPGSYAPLALMLLIFAVKYGVAVSMAIHPAWRHDADFMLAVCFTYGALSGSMLGRALRLRLVHRRDPQTTPVAA